MQANHATFSMPRLRVLRVDASARGEDSVTRQLADRMLHELGGRAPDLSVVRRDVAAGLPVVDAAWVGANAAEADARDAAQRQALALSDELVAELMAADVLVIATPIYNFGVPGSPSAIPSTARRVCCPARRPTFWLQPAVPRWAAPSTSPPHG